MVTIKDNELPAITCPAAIVQNTDAGKCEAAMSITAATAIDNCPGAAAVGVRNDGKPLTDAYPKGITTITWTATDAAGNNTGCDQTVTINDNEPPAITCPAAIVQNTDAGKCEAVVSITAATATDNCSEVNVVGVRNDGKPLTDAYPKGITTITWTATDAAGNKTACAQTVTINDNEPPAITCLAAIVQNTDLGKCEAAVSITVATATDNCPGAAVVGVRNDGKPLTDAYPKGITTITWTATDPAGNHTSCDQTVTIKDNEPPTITCPAAIRQNTHAGKCEAVVSITAATATDNCPGVAVVGVRDDGKLLVDAYPKGVTTITWSATDTAGNKSACDQTVTINDNEPPTITCLAAIVHNTDAGKCEAVVSITAATATDNCPGVVVVGVRNDTKALTDAYPKGVTTITWTATDAAGNKSTCDQSVTVNDNEPPSISCPAAIVQNTDAGKCEAVVSITVATATDNCPGVVVVGVRNDGKLLTDVYPKGVTTITWTATDPAGNHTSCDQTVTINDNEPPAITCPAAIVQNTDLGKCEAVVSITVATATDN